MIIAKHKERHLEMQLLFLRLRLRLFWQGLVFFPAPMTRISPEFVGRFPLDANSYFCRLFLIQELWLLISSSFKNVWTNNFIMKNEIIKIMTPSFRIKSIVLLAWIRFPQTISSGLQNWSLHFGRTRWFLHQPLYKSCRRLGHGLWRVSDLLRHKL